MGGFLSWYIETIVGFDSIAIEHGVGVPSFTVADIDVALVSGLFSHQLLIDQKFIGSAEGWVVQISRVSEGVFSLTEPSLGLF